MKIAIISDIHGNIEALTAVLERLESSAVAHIISLGDNIGYGPNPNEVMTLLARKKAQSILGNHEMVIRHPRFMNWFNPVARKSVIQTTANLSSHHVKTIHTLEESMVKGNLRFVHGVPPHSPFLYPFQLSDTALARKIWEMDQSVCFCGHTHELEIIESTDPSQLIRRPLLREGETLKKNPDTLSTQAVWGSPGSQTKTPRC